MSSPRIDLRLGDYRDVLLDVECDAVITDPPYSPRVHEGQRTGSETAKATIEYEPLSEGWCREFAEYWSRRTRWWAVVMSDHTGARWWEAAWEAVGWYVFSPVIHRRVNATPRVAGDGPTSAVDYITVSRPRRRMPKERAGSRPGYYESIQASWTVAMPGGKALQVMSALVADYTISGDIVCDPCAGMATTALACGQQFHPRRFVGAEIDPETHARATERLSGGVQIDMFRGAV